MKRVSIPIEPTEEILLNMAYRYRHDFGLEKSLVRFVLWLYRFGASCNHCDNATVVQRNCFVQFAK